MNDDRLERRDRWARLFRAQGSFGSDETRESIASELARIAPEEIGWATERDGIHEDDPELPAPTRLLDAEEIEPPGFQTQGMILDGDLNLFASDGGVGKSGAGLLLGGCTINETAAFGNPLFAIRRAGPVLYVSEEDDLGVIRNRMEALARGQGWDIGHTLGHFYTLAREGTSLDSDAWKAHLLLQIQSIGAVLVIFDPYSELTTANENDNSENKPIIRFFRRITNETGAAVLVMHHLGKAVEGKRKLDRIRGFSALRDAARLVFFLERTELGTSFECLKMSRAEPTPKFVARREVETDPENPASWVSARMTYLEETVADEMEAEKFVVFMLEKYGTLNSTQIKELAKGEGPSAVEVSKAISTLESLKRIDYEPGKHGAKNWRLTRLPKNPGQGRQPGLPGLPNIAGQASEAGPGGCPAPLGAGNQAATDLPAGQGQQPDFPDGDYERFERLAIQQESEAA